MQISKMNGVNFGSVIPVKGKPQNVKALDDLLWENASNKNYGIVDLEDKACSTRSFYEDRDEVSRLYGSQQLALVTGKDWANYVTGKTSANRLLQKSEEMPVLNADSMSAKTVGKVIDLVDND